jgi:PST family polysaccharide transporter
MSAVAASRVSGASTAKASLTTGFGQAWRLAMTMTGTLVLGRLLSPTDFGLAAMIAPVVALAMLLQDLGLSQAAIQRSKISTGHLSALFYVSLGVSAMLTLLMMAASPLVAAFYKRPELTAFVAAFSALIFLTGASSQPTAILQRHLSFTALAWADALGASAGLATGIATAYAWRSYWALFAGPLANAFVQLAIVWISAGWRPTRPDFAGGFGQLVGFGGKVTTSNALNFLSRNADNVLIGRYAGSAALGYYDRAYKLLLVPLVQINAPLFRVMFPTLSILKDDAIRYRALYLSCVGVILTLAHPGTLFLVMHAHSVVPMLLGRQWEPAAGIFVWLGVAALHQPLTSTMGWLFISQGRTDEFMKICFYSAITTVLSFVVGLHWGALGVAIVYCVTDYTLRAPVQWWLASTSGPIRRQDMLLVVLTHSAALALATASILVLDACGLHRTVVGLGVELLATYVAYVGGLSVTSYGRSLLVKARSLVEPTLGRAQKV